ncbi:MAG: TIGR04255 family protein [Woeseiaceae bacterium]
MGLIADKHGDLNNHPLVYTLFMLRFPKQTTLDSVVPSIQASLKKEYPIYETRVQQSIEIAQGQDGQSFSTFAVTEHLFFDGERKKGILVKDDRVVFHTTVYPGFVEFSSCFMDATQAVVDALEISHYESIGIRYVDALIPDYENNESLEDLLDHSLLSFEIDDESISQCVASRQINHYTTSEGVLVLKANLLLENDVSVPPELRDISSLLRFEEKEKKGSFCVLDFDHAFMAPDDTVLELNLEELVEKVDKMHDIISRAFLKTINEDNIGKWK